VGIPQKTGVILGGFKACGLQRGQNARTRPRGECDRLGQRVEYKIFGRFSGQDVYEPASNGTYPEFILERAELRSKTPGPIFRNRKALDPKERYYPNPY
jgi:hypothetical protein